jgi:hypothetical protein
LARHRLLVKILDLVDEKEKLVRHGLIGGKPATVSGTTL